MISFDIDHVRFHYRAAGVFLREGHVLLCTVEGLDFWFVPGGRCEVMETSAETVARELREELGEKARVERIAVMRAGARGRSPRDFFFPLLP